MALDYVYAPAYLVTDEVVVRAMSPAGRELMAQDPRTLMSRLARVCSGEGSPPQEAVLPLAGSLFFVVLEGPTDAEVPRRVHALARSRGLTPAQTRVLLSLAAGLTNRGIALELNLSRRTVETHVVAILDKLGVASRAAVLASLLTPPQPSPSGVPHSTVGKPPRRSAPQTSR